jgi:threonine synthase
MSFVRGLQCRECGQDYPKEPLHVCETCFGPLEIVYDYAAIGKNISREKIAARDKNLWRYRELLPTASRRLGCTLATPRWSKPINWQTP